MIDKNNPIINGFCYMDGKVMVCIDLVTEKPKKYSAENFKAFIKENDINETYIILINIDNGTIIPLYRYKLESKNENIPIRARDRSLDILIDTCYQICIQLTSPV